MLKVVAKRYLKSGCLDEYVRLAKELIDQTRQEEGCADYGLYYDPAQNLAVMMETWESQADLDRHLQHITSLGWPAKLNTYADPDRPGSVEQFQSIY